MQWITSKEKHYYKHQQAKWMKEYDFSWQNTNKTTKHKLIFGFSAKPRHSQNTETFLCS